MLEFTKAISTKSGINLPTAFFKAHSIRILDHFKKCRVTFVAYRDQAAFGTAQELPRDDLPFDLSITFDNVTPVELNGTVYMEVYDNHIVPGLDAQSLINKIKIFVEAKLGLVTWI